MPRVLLCHVNSRENVHAFACILVRFKEHVQWCILFHVPKSLGTIKHKSTSDCCNWKKVFCSHLQMGKIDVSRRQGQMPGRLTPTLMKRAQLFSFSLPLTTTYRFYLCEQERELKGLERCDKIFASAWLDAGVTCAHMHTLTFS